MFLAVFLIISHVNSSLSEMNQPENSNSTTNIISKKRIRSILDELAAIEESCYNVINPCIENNTIDTSNSHEEDLHQDDNDKPLSPVLKDENNFSQDVQMTDESDTFVDELTKNGIKPINSNIPLKRCSNSKIITKKIHEDMLCVFWYVFHGFYENSVKINRLHIQYDSNTFFFMKGDPFGVNIMLYDDIFKFVRDVYMNSTAYRDTHVHVKKKRNSHSYDAENTDCPNICTQNDYNWFSELIHNHKENDDDFSQLKTLGDKMDDCKNIDIKHINSTSTFCYLIRNADTFFDLLSINSAYFRSIVRIHDIYYRQLDILFVQNISTKLCVFPVLLSLYKHHDTIKSVKHDEHNRHKMCIGHYVLCRFEAFIEYFRKLLSNNCLCDLYKIDIAFLRMYVVELYITYLFRACFNIDSRCVIMYVLMNRLQTVSIHDTSLHTYKLIEFMMYNLLDLNSDNKNEFFDKLIIRLLKKDETNVLVKDLLHIFLNSKEYRANVIGNFIANMMSIENNNEAFKTSVLGCYAEIEPSEDKNTSEIIDELITKIKEKLMEAIK